MADDQGAAAEKPLEKMTIKELKAVAVEIPEITGAHGMNKEELLEEIKKSRGIVEEKKESDVSVRQLKKDIRALREKRDEARKAREKKRVAFYRRRISRLKKKTRRAAA
ncbi:Rho termination protein [Candidatus Desulfarcum epimagneticum]|uniref:Rho termination protein n=1 Tax=uncultured Desulfobacteraceae bacterium TaxID=218296 RepID=A0A484HD67_9BACT|nr:Rho termination protein [uncultured Desulfobacteraceae bacterium]